MKRLLIKNCSTIVTMDESERVLKNCDIYIQNDRIESILPGATPPPADISPDNILDAGGLTAIPGLIQTHIHLCQTPFRNTADDVELLDWLSQHIWPGEASLNFDSLKLGARMGIAELLQGGTTCILDMATIRHTEAVFEALDESGIRGFSGKSLMDDRETCPPVLVEDTATALQETEELIEKWHGHDNGRIGVAVTPRFAISCTPDLMRKAVDLQQKKGLLLHTHASENRKEIELVRKRTGLGNLEYFENIGLLGKSACLAHCVHMEDGDLDRLARFDAKVLHCPGSNLKLASGIAPVPEMLKRGICVSLGADGAPCNNLLDGFMEMRLAALIQKPANGPASMKAKDVFRLATVEGARALGKEKEIGRIAAGFKADIALVDLNHSHNLPSHNVYSTLVYGSLSSDVRHVLVDGKILMRNRNLLRARLPEWTAEFQEKFSHESS